MTSTNEEQTRLLSDNEVGLDEDYNPRKKFEQVHRHKLYRALIYSAFGFFCVVLVAAISSSLHLHKPPKARFPCLDTHKGYICHTPISQSWGQYSPFYQVPSTISTSLPPTCHITFAQILSRHGARDPTFHKSASYARLISKLQSQVPQASFIGPYTFLSNYTYTLGSDQLTSLGEQQMYDAGSDFYTTYLPFTKTTTPFIRASGQTRVVESAEHFALGFHHASTGERSSPKTPPYPILTIPELPGQNSTLSHNTQCPSFHSPQFPNEQSTYLSTFLPSIAARLAAALPNSNLSDPEIIDFMSLCPFTNVALPPSSTTLSPFCSLFSTLEWASYAHAATLGKYFAHGPGHPLGPTQGVGWVNELIARLTQSPVADRTTTNRTLDAAPSEESEDSATFPLRRGLYADFTHDNEMVSIFAAMRLLEEFVPEREMYEVGVGGWVPFAGRLVVEGMECDGLEKEQEGLMVRAVMNGRVVPLGWCGGDEEGRCTLDAFVGGLKFAREGGRWDECFEWHSLM